GVVYVGEQQMGSTVRKVAIKTLHQHLSREPSVLARFHRECGTVAELEHPNTIKVYDFGSTTDGRLYIAMEFVAGRSLAAVIEAEKRLAPDRVVKILRQVCGALDEAHGKGIIHRDLKPDNVVLTDRAGETDFVKVLDFGIAARSESGDAQREQKLTQQGMVLGTPPYMSPEQFTGKALDARSDVYSLGVMAYEMLTGRLPFHAETPWEWATQHMTAQPMPFETALPNGAIPKAMQDAVMKALAKDREQRQTSAREFFEELSSGARMTPEVAPIAENVRTGTAAMDALPDFGTAVAPPPVMAPPVSPADRGVTPTAAVAPAPVPPVIRKPPARGGGKGLIVGLGTLGAVLLVAMAVVATRSTKPDDVAPPLTNEPVAAQQAPPETVASLAPLETAPDPPPVTDPAPEATSTRPATTSTQRNPPTTTTRTPTTTPTTAPTTPATTPTTVPTTPPAPTTTTPPPSGGGSCASCVAKAQAGDVAGAAQVYAACSEGTEKKECLKRIKAAAPNAAKAAARNGQCDRARAIIAAAEHIGASTPSLGRALDGTSCK
ncbi:MAG: protein kinase, partial [Pseudomonadota bacterium]